MKAAKNILAEALKDRRETPVAGRGGLDVVKSPVKRQQKKGVRL